MNARCGNVQNRKLRVGIIGPCPPPHGGVTRIIGNHLQYWREMPIETWLMSPAVPAQPQVYPEATLFEGSRAGPRLGGSIAAAARIGARLPPSRPTSWGRTLAFDCIVRDSIGALQLDVLYAHHATATGMIAVSEARRAGIPVVVVSYGETWLAEAEHARWRRAIDFSVQRADWVVSTSEHCRRGALRRGAQAERSSVIYAGIDLQRFRPGLDGSSLRKQHAIPESAVVISVLGLALRRKLDTFLDALAPLLADPSVYVLIGGTGDDAAYLAERVRQIPGERVKALGFVPERDLPPFYAATDIMVVAPRTVVECMGQSMKEAMCCARPVVGPRLGGVPEALEDGNCGLMFEPDNPTDLVRALRELVADRERRAAMGLRGRAVAEAKFDARISAEQTYELLARLARASAR